SPTRRSAPWSRSNPEPRRPARQAHTEVWDTLGGHVLAPGCLVRAPAAGFGCPSRTKCPTSRRKTMRTQLKLKAVGMIAAAFALALGVGVATAATITGDEGDNVLVGTPKHDKIDAKAGNDTVTALGGPDKVMGGPGNDTIDGGKGH